MLRVIIIDDEKKGRQVLELMLKKYCENVEITAVADSAEAGRKAIRQYKPDLVFLDVEMPAENGFDLLQSFEKIDFNVVFVTAHDHYAVKAIKISALDYLLKPINLEELKQAVGKAEKSRKQSQPEDQYKLLFQSLKTSQSKIGVPTRQGLVFVEVNEIIRCEAQSNYTTIYLSGGEKHIAAKTLKEFEQSLADFDFIRVHQSHLVNAHHIKQYIKGDGGFLILSDKTEVEVSRRHKEILLEKMRHL